MPHFTLQLTPHGPIVSAVLAISRPRAHALQQAGHSEPEPVSFAAMVDTGASSTCLDASLLEPLQLTPTGQVKISTPSSGQEPVWMEQYDVTLLIPGPDGSPPLVFPTIPIVALKNFATAHYGGLIGRDILAECLLSYNGTARLLTLAY